MTFNKLMISNSGHVQFTVTVNSDRNPQLFIIRCTGQLNVVNLGVSLVLT